MTKIDDGGPAFARSMSQGINGEIYYEQDGMSLRDFFANGAMQGLCSVDFELASGWGEKAKGKGISTQELFAEVAFRVADAMIKARKGEK